MLSWIFRHRQRLQVIYGVATVPALAGTRFAREAPDPGGILAVARAEEVQPGGIAWHGKHLLLRPLPPAA